MVFGGRWVVERKQGRIRLRCRKTAERGLVLWEREGEKDGTDLRERLKPFVAL